MTYLDRLDNFLNKNTIKSDIEITNNNVNSIISIWWLPKDSISWKVNQTFAQDNPPTGSINIGDTWTDTNDDNTLYRWDWSDWIDVNSTVVIPWTLDTRWFTNSLAFSSTWYSNITWWWGTLSFANWTSYTISSWSNTNTTTSPIYIYLDTDISSTVLQATTTPSLAVWSNKCLVCVKKTNSASTKNAQFQVMWGSDSWVFITADNIAANTISASEIVANTIDTWQLEATAIDGMTITGSTIRTNDATHPYVNINATGVTISGTSVLNFITSAGSGSGYIGGDSTNGLEMSNSAGKIYLFWRYGIDILTNASNSMSITTSTLNIDATWALGTGVVSIKGNIIPSANNTYDLWDSTHRLDNVYADDYHWDSISIYYSWTKYWKLHVDSSSVYLESFSSKNIKIKSDGNIIMDTGSYWYVEPYETTTSLWSSWHPWKTVVATTVTIWNNVSYNLSTSWSVMVLNGYTKIQVASYSFKPVGFTFKDGGGDNKYLIVLATTDPVSP